MRTTGVATHVGLVSVSSTRGGARALPPRPPRALRCNAGGTKPDVSLTKLQKGPKIGEGSFGNVYEGLYDGDQRVVLKEYKAVRGRDNRSFYDDELKNCRRLADCEGVAEFMGVAGADVYLVWRYQGAVTLERVLASGGGLDALAEVLNVDDAAAAFGLFASSLLLAANAVHVAGVVHRDIKPGNILLAQPTGKSESCAVKLIDLGGAADLNSQLRDGEAIFDPTYGGPEQFNLVKGLFGNKMEATGVEPTFQLDAYSVGLVLLQLATPSLHTEPAMRVKCRQQLDLKCGGQLYEWRKSAPKAGVDLSGMDELGAWDLVLGLTERNPDERLSVYDALRTPFLKKYTNSKLKKQKKKGWFS